MIHFIVAFMCMWRGERFPSNTMNKKFHLLPYKNFDTKYILYLVNMVYITKYMVFIDGIYNTWFTWYT